MIINKFRSRIKMKLRKPVMSFPVKSYRFISAFYLFLFYIIFIIIILRVRLCIICWCENDPESYISRMSASVRDIHDGFVDE